MKQLLINNINCKIGSNSKENWEILETANHNYLFFHLSSFPSCYVILETNDISDNNSILKAALECKKHTKYKNLKNIKVDYCYVSNLEKGDVVGEVIFKSNRKIKNIIV
jgi:hypothetical protein